MGVGGLELVNFFSKNSNLEKKICLGGVGGCRGSEFFLQRIQIIFFLGGGGMGVWGVEG